MSANTKRLPPALKHGAFSATTILPGESESKLKKSDANSIIAESDLKGVLEARNRLVPGSPHLAKKKPGDFFNSGARSGALH